MLSPEERKVLEIIDSRLLITEKELSTMLARQSINGSEYTVRKLRDSGYIDKVESLGTCIVITQKGMRVLKK